MKRITICLLALFWLTATPAFGINAIEYFNLGLKSSYANKKIEYFTKALKLDPSLAAAYKNRGTFYYFQEKYDKVIQDFENYVKLVPYEVEPYRMLGLGYLKKGLKKAAIYNFSHAIELDPNSASAYANRAEAYRLSKKYKKAISDSTKVVELPGDPRIISGAYSTRGKAYRAIGRYELADADMEKSYYMDPTFLLPMECLFRDFSKYTNPEDIRTIGLLVLIGVTFVLIFGIKLRSPRKNE